MERRKEEAQPAFENKKRELDEIRCTEGRSIRNSYTLGAVPRTLRERSL